MTFVFGERRKEESKNETMNVNRERPTKKERQCQERNERDSKGERLKAQMRNGWHCTLVITSTNLDGAELAGLRHGFGIPEESEGIKKELRQADKQKEETKKHSPLNQNGRKKKRSNPKSPNPTHQNTKLLKASTSKP